MRAKFYDDKRVVVTQKKWSELRFDGNTFTTKMDPDSQAVRYPIPVPLYGRRNRLYDVEYLGGLNDADSTVASATLDRTGSQYKLFDAGQLPIMFAYLGLGMNTVSRNDAYNQQFVNIMLESLSAAYATQLTDIAFMTSTYATDIPQMASGQSAVVGFMVWYQSIVQNIASLMAKFNSTLSLVDYLIKMGYNGEAPQITAYTNLLKKQNVYSLMEQIGVIMSQEYVDLDWFKEISVLNGMPSRMDDDVQSPLLTIVGSTYVPGIEVSKAGVELIDTMNSGGTHYNDFNAISVTANGVTKTYTLQGLTQHIMSLLDPINILAVCRQIHEGTTTVTVVSQINDLIESLKAMVQTCAVFKNVTVDFRTFLMLLQDSTNLNRWVIGTPYVKPSRPRIQVDPEYFRIVHDIFKAFGTSGNLVFDTTTRKWKVYTLWKGGEGIAEYDAYNGGFAISTSVRSIPVNGSGIYTGPEYMFPRMFYRYSEGGNISYQWFVNRLGYAFEMKVTSMNAANLASDPFFAYINMIADSAIIIDVPTVTLTSLTTDKVLMSTISKIMNTIFGISVATYGSGGSAITNKTIDYANIGFVGRQFGQYAEAAIEYLTARAPLRQIDKDVNIGFRFGSGTSRQEM